MFKAHPKSRPAEIKFMGQIGLRLRYLPHSIKLKPYPRGILVSWEDNETEAFRTLGSGGPDYHVVLHEGNCASAETAFLHEKAGQWQSAIQGDTANPSYSPHQRSGSLWLPSAVRSSDTSNVPLYRSVAHIDILCHDCAGRGSGILRSSI
jgi:hypothetical protein